MEFTRDTKTGASIKFERTIDEGATRAIKANTFSKSKVKVKKKKLGRILSKPKVSIKRLDAIKTLTRGRGHTRLVTEGEEGYFKKELSKERTNFLGRHSL